MADTELLVPMGTLNMGDPWECTQLFPRYSNNIINVIGDCESSESAGRLVSLEPNLSKGAFLGEN